MLSKVVKKFFKEKNVDESFSNRIDKAKTIGEIADIVAEPGLEMSTEEFDGILYFVPRLDFESEYGGRRVPAYP